MTEVNAEARIAAFEEFMLEQRKKLWVVYADPNIPQALKNELDESFRKVFYAGYAAGFGLGVVASYTGGKTQ